MILPANPNSDAAVTAAMVTIAARHFPDVRGWTNLAGPWLILNPA